MAIIIPEKYTVPLYLFHQGENSHAYEYRTERAAQFSAYGLLMRKQ
jgi:hypothetical protein